MSWQRLSTLWGAETRSQLLRPMFWVLAVLLVLVSWGLSSGGLTISTGDSSVGGQKVWLNSQYNLSLIFVLVGFLLYCFFSAIAAGMSVIRDDEEGVSELLHSTPLKPAEYVGGKFAGVMVALTVAMAIHLLATIVCFQFLPVANPEEIRGPFELSNYLVPMLLFTAPIVLFFGGLAFAVGERTRSPILVFVVPIAIFLICSFFLWSWTPSWLDPRIDRLLMILDPSGYRWLNENLLKVDRGVEYYNTARLEVDGTFWLNRLWVTLVPLGAVALSISHVKKAVAGEAEGLRLFRRRKTKDLAAADESAATVLETEPLASLEMTQSRRGFLAEIREVAGAEFRELRNQPGLYLFVPLILLQILGSSLSAIGAFDTPVLLTAGTIAVGSANTITLLVCLLLLFYTVESLARERNTGFDSIFYATPLRSASILFGKSLANALVGAVIVLAAFVGAAIAILVQGRTPLDLGPFVLIWGVLLIPTFLLWNSFVMATQALTRNRYTTYAIALAALALTFYHQFRGNMTWVWNWNLWGAVVWSDISVLEMDRSPLILNRVTALGATVFLTAFAVKLFGRTDFDPARVVNRLQPRALLRGAIRLAPYALLPIVTGSVLAHQVRVGYQSESAEKRQKDYWRKNLATYRDADVPAVEHIELDMELFPERRGFTAEGSYRFTNHLDREIDAIPMTGSAVFEEISFSLDGESTEAKNRSDLWVVDLPAALQPGDETTVGFSVTGTYPRGASKNGGGSGTFVLPSGVVLHIFAPMFMPVPGYNETIGIDEDNRYEPEEYPDDFWKETLDSAFGNPFPFTTRVEITAPEDLTVNSVGELVSDTTEGGKRTVVWQSDYPVKLFNIVAGRWSVKRQGGTALFYHPEHDYNVDEISNALAAARKYYSEWFYPYPWQELKVSEFPGLATYAQGFPTNITFSEQIGFLTKSDPKSQLAFLVTAHEAAHQWWGNLVTPGVGPGGNILSEGMAHYSTLLLHGQVVGERERIEFCRRIEERYGDNRQVDSERPLVKIDGSRAGDQTVTYDKGGWVMWMLHNHLGQENALAGLQEFVTASIEGPDHPVLQDLVETLRPYAEDPEAYQDFVDQWYFDVVLPEYRLADLETEKSASGWHTAFTVENIGTGRMPIEIAAQRGVRFPESDDGEAAVDENGPFTEQRQTVVLGAGDKQRVTLETSFEPTSIVVDPDALVLQLNRAKATVEVESAS